MKSNALGDGRRKRLNKSLADRVNQEAPSESKVKYQVAGALHLATWDGEKAEIYLLFNDRLTPLGDRLGKVKKLFTANNTLLDVGDYEGVRYSYGSGVIEDCPVSEDAVSLDDFIWVIEGGNAIKIGTAMHSESYSKSGLHLTSIENHKDTLYFGSRNGRVIKGGENPHNIISTIQSPVLNLCSHDGDLFYTSNGIIYKVVDDQKHTDDYEHIPWSMNEGGIALQAESLCSTPKGLAVLFHNTISIYDRNGKPIVNYDRLPFKEKITTIQWFEKK